MIDYTSIHNCCNKLPNYDLKSVEVALNWVLFNQKEIPVETTEAHQESLEKLEQVICFSLSLDLILDFNELIDLLRKIYKQKDRRCFKR